MVQRYKTLSRRTIRLSPITNHQPIPLNVKLLALETREVEGLAGEEFY